MTKKKTESKARFGETERVRDIRRRYAPKPAVFTSSQALGDIEHLLERSDGFREAGEVLVQFVEEAATKIRMGEDLEAVAKRCELMVEAAKSAFGLGPNRVA